MNAALPPAISRDDYRALRVDPDRWRAAVVAICARHGLGAGALRPLGGSNLVMAIDGARIVKVFPPFLRDQWESERLALAQLRGAISMAIPELVHDGELDGWTYLVMTELAGRSLEVVWPVAAEPDRLDLLQQLGELIAEVHRVPPGPIAHREPGWDDFVRAQRDGCLARHAQRGLPEPLERDLAPYLDRTRAALPRDVRPVILTGEYTPENLLVEQRDGRWRLVGLIDFGDVMSGAAEYDLLGPSTFLASGRPERVRSLLLGRGYAEADLTPMLRDRLMTLLLLHRHSDLDLQLRIDGWRDRARTLDELADLIWPFA